MLELTEIHKRYKSKVVLKGVSIKIPTGQFFALLGPSGCGKSSLLNVINGTTSQDRGSIVLNGEDISEISANKRKVNTVFQNYSLFPHLNVFDNIAFGKRLQKATKNEVKHSVLEVLELVQLLDYAKANVIELSGGQQQRVALARAIICQPKLLLLDEPLAALDPNLREEMQSSLKSIQKQLNITFVFVTHSQKEAMSLADNIGIMYDGAILQTGTPTELYNRPLNHFVAKFMGDFNVIHKNNGIRPERIKISTEMVSGSININGKINSKVFLGSTFKYRVDTNLGSMQVISSDAMFEIGQEVYIYWTSKDEINY